jgi:hypothetical protein
MGGCYIFINIVVFICVVFIEPRIEGGTNDPPYPLLLGGTYLRLASEASHFKEPIILL